MDRSTFLQLLPPAGQEVIQAAAALSPHESDFLSHYQSLSRVYPPELARAALEIAILRLEAASKFPFADQLYLTRPALEQASSHEVSTYRLQRYHGYPLLADLGCSVGSDTFTLAWIAPTLALDIDPLRVLMASANLHTLGLSGRSMVIQSDLTVHLPITQASTGLFFDPARRLGHRRFFSVHQYRPPLSIINEWLPSFPALGVKISPGVDLSELSMYDAELEFISMNGELKEAVLWFGPLKTARRRATILPGSYHLVSHIASPPLPSKIPISPPQSYLYEPDPAIIRSGLVDCLAELVGASQLDPTIAYLTADKLIQTPFARCWLIEAWFPFQLKRLRAYLHQHSIGRITVKKRGSPLEPDFLIHQLRLRGDQERVVVLTLFHRQPIVLICIRV